MATLEEITVGATVTGLDGARPVTVVGVAWHGPHCLTATYRDASSGRTGERLLFRSDEATLSVTAPGRAWSFAGDGGLFRLVAEAQRIRLAYLYDPLLAVHISRVEPLPHQIAAVYERMLPRQPLRFLLADDPGAGKTIMAGLLIRELLLRGDLARCLIVVPANLADQWQDELAEKFGLDFIIVGREQIEHARSGNPFADHAFVISRMDLLKQDDNLERLRAVEWDLVVVDEAHKLSASRSGDEITYTARYRLGELLGRQTRHYLLLTATPHRGKDEDFQLFLALLDADRFAGRPREGTRQVDISDLMRRMLKEELVDFDGHPLFPERQATTINYELTDDEATLYELVTAYVREQMARAERAAAEEDGAQRRVVVGFALTMLQRRLASSPAAIYASLQRRLRRLEQRLREAQQSQRVAVLAPDLLARLHGELEEDLEDQPEGETQEIVDLATASRTVQELRAEIDTLKRLTALAKRICDSGTDRKWEQLRAVLDYPEMFDAQGQRRKLVIFTEHRDTLDYLVARITNLLGRSDAVVAIHGGLLREERRKAQAAFLNDPRVLILVATDAAGEGINLQRAHLMVNYDLPWNPNRIEQRFGRIHRFGQREPCHLWNLVAYQTREGAVYQRLFEKLEEARRALGGKVFDVLGRALTEVELRKLILEAISYNTTEDARAYLQRCLDQTWTPDFLRRLVDEYALDATTITASDLRALKEMRDRAEARRLVPHFIEAFFVDAFTRLGGSLVRREPGRYEITHVPIDLRRRDRLIGQGEQVQRAYERICFEKARVDVAGKPPATFVAPGHPLLEATIDLLLERYGSVLTRGTVLVDETDAALPPRVLFAIESVVTDGRHTAVGDRRVISRRLEYVEIDMDGNATRVGAAPYLDYRPLHDDEVPRVAELLGAPWLRGDLEAMARDQGIVQVVQPHLEEVRDQRLALIAKTRAAVRARLTDAIRYWDYRSVQLAEREAAGEKTRLSSLNARRRCEELSARLEQRMRELDEEADIVAQPPLVRGVALVVPAYLLQPASAEAEALARETRRIEQLAMAEVMRREREAGRNPCDVSRLNRGWDIESVEPDGRIRYIEVKGRAAGADTVTVTKNELLACLNKRDQYYLAVVIVEGERVREYWLQSDPLHGDWAFALAKQTLDLATLRGETRHDRRDG